LPDFHLAIRGFVLMCPEFFSRPKDFEHGADERKVRCYLARKAFPICEENVSFYDKVGEDDREEAQFAG
jgi:hypothetical protein